MVHRKFSKSLLNYCYFFNFFFYKVKSTGKQSKLHSFNLLATLLRYTSYHVLAYNGFWWLYLTPSPLETAPFCP